MDIKTIRSKYPQYKDLSDKQLADALHNKYYSDMPVEQFYAKIGLSQNNFNTFSQQSSDYSQSKTPVNKTISAVPQAKIAINPIEKTSYLQQSQTDNSIYFWVVAIVAIVIYFVSKQNNEDTAQNKKSDNNSGSYKFVFVFSILMTILMFFAGAINTSDGSHNPPVGIVLWGYLSWLIYKKNNKKIVNFLKGLLWLGSIILINSAVFWIFTLFSIFLDSTFSNTFAFTTILVSFVLSIYYALYMFFKKQLFYESENSNSRYDNNSQYDYRHNRQQEHTSSNNQNNYKKQDDETSNNNNNYQYENKQNEQSYHKSSDSKQHSTFDDRLDELKSNIAKCYEILEVPQNATPSEIKSAFKKKMSSYHPDKVSGLGEKLRKVAEEESKLINVAYQTLKSKGKC
jgi:hypothetical protein